MINFFDELITSVAVFELRINSNRNAKNIFASTDSYTRRNTAAHP